MDKANKEYINMAEVSHVTCKICGKRIRFEDALQFKGLVYVGNSKFAFIESCYENVPYTFFCNDPECMAKSN